MSTDEHWVVAGESYLSFEAVADCYGVRVEWLLEACELHLLGSIQQVQGRHALRTAMLDRVAQLRRICQQTGLELGAVAVVFQFDED